MLSALILLRPAATAKKRPGARLDSEEARRARAMADFLQLYNPTALLSAPERVCSETLGPLAGRLGVAVDAQEDLAAEVPEFPGGDSAHTAAWLAARAVRALPDPRRTAVVCARSAVLSALLVAVASRDGHELTGYDFELPFEDDARQAPGGGWVLQRDDGLLVEVKPLAAP